MTYKNTSKGNPALPKEKPAKPVKPEKGSKKDKD